MSPFCDYLTVTAAEEFWLALRAAVVPELDAAGLSLESDSGSVALWVAPGGLGVVRAERKRGVRVLSASGGVCGLLRGCGRWLAYLGAIATVPHRVTRLDATVDLPVDAPAVIEAVAALGRSGAVSLTRKAVRPRDVLTLLGQRWDGLLSGTVYLGARQADVRLTVYDKRQERVERALLGDPGPLTRYELKLRSGTGVTLRDASDPAAVFWHYMPAGVLAPPSPAPVWAPAAVGYVLERSPALSPAERLYRRLQDSAEFAALVALAGEFPGGVDYLCAEVRRRVGDPARRAAVIATPPCRGKTVTALDRDG